jgi:predicted Zn-dependent protease
MKTFLAKYISSNNTFEIDATILLLPKYISIGYNSENDLHQKEIWNYSAIEYKYDQSIQSTILKNKELGNTIIIPEHNAVADIKAFIDYDAKPWAAKTFTKNRIKLFGVFLFLIGLLIALYLVFVPYLSERLAIKLPKKHEVSMGDQLFHLIVDTSKKDVEKTALLNEYFKTLEINTEYPIRITVLNDATVNAFAVMGGHIVVYNGILQKLNSHEELAALLSHEFTHVNNKHSTRAIFRALGSKVFLSLLLGRIGNLSSVVLDNADRFNGMNYSRKLEKEADINGLELLNNRKINTNGFIDLFTHLKEASGGKDISELLSSHPDIEKRIKYVKANPLFNTGTNSEMNKKLQSIFEKIVGKKDTPDF